MINDKQRILDELFSRIDNIKRQKAKFPLDGNFLVYTSQINCLENFYSWIQTGMRIPKRKQRQRFRDNRTQLEGVTTKRMRKVKNGT